MNRPAPRGRNLASRRAGCEKHLSGSVRGAPREGGAYSMCDWHEQQTGGGSPNRGPDGGNPTPRRQGLGTGAPVLLQADAKRCEAREGRSGGSHRCVT